MYSSALVATRIGFSFVKYPEEQLSILRIALFFRML